MTTRPNVVRDLLAPRLLADGWTMAEVGKLFGVSRQRIHQLFPGSTGRESGYQVGWKRRNPCDIELRNKMIKHLYGYLSADEMTRLSGLSGDLFAGIYGVTNGGRWASPPRSRKQSLCLTRYVLREVTKLILAAAYVDGASTRDVAFLAGSSEDAAAIFIHHNRRLFPRRTPGGRAWAWGAPVEGKECP